MEQHPFNWPLFSLGVGQSTKSTRIERRFGVRFNRGGWARACMQIGPKIVQLAREGLKARTTNSSRMAGASVGYPHPPVETSRRPSLRSANDGFQIRQMPLPMQRPIQPPEHLALGHRAGDGRGKGVHAAGSDAASGGAHGGYGTHTSRIVENGGARSPRGGVGN